MFKTLSLGRLPRVMVKTLALPMADQGVIVSRILRLAEVNSGAPWEEAFTAAVLDPDGECDLARAFESILDLPKEDRRVFVGVFDDVLDGLLGEDFFGTEGQSDPRGDHRDND